MREGRREVGERGAAAIPPALVSSGGQHQANVVVGALADKVDAAGRGRHQGRGSTKALLKKGGIVVASMSSSKRGRKPGAAKIEQ